MEDEPRSAADTAFRVSFPSTHLHGGNEDGGAVPTRRLPALANRGISTRSPGWSPAKARHRSCPVCGSDAPAPVVMRPDGFIVHACLDCAMIYLADVPRQEEIDGFYEQYSARKGLRPRRSRSSWLRLKLTAARSLFISILESTGGIRGFSVCEIGCSHGGFLEQVRYKGGRPFGIELDDDAQETLRVTGIPFAAEILPDQRFAVICLLQVLEHLDHPHELISCVSRALEAEGRVLISVPNAGEYAKSGPSWLGFRVDLEHLNYFNLRSLSSLLLAHHLYVENYWEHSQPCLPPYAAEHDRVSPVRRARERMAGIIRRYCLPGQAVHQGRFLLSVLARKG